MKRIVNRYTYPTILALVVMFLAFAVTGGACFAQAASGEPGTAQPFTEGSPRGGPIKDLHRKLKITPEQESLERRRPPCGTMIKTMEAPVTGKIEKWIYESCRRPESYGEIVEAHASGIKNFILAFEPLYTGMSDAQRRLPTYYPLSSTMPDDAS